ncbi:MAG: HNH endonuclease [Mycoplasmatales bacterium]
MGERKIVIAGKNYSKKTDTFLSEIRKDYLNDTQNGIYSLTTGIINFIDFYENYMIFRTNNNERSKDWINKNIENLRKIFNTDDIIQILLTISNNDKESFIFKAFYNYCNIVNDLESLNSYKEEQQNIIEHSFERLSTSNVIRNEVILQANGKCFFKCTNEMFLNRSDEVYLETHHIIPVKLAKSKFKDYPTLDRIENIVALCPTCHKRLHFEKNDSTVFLDKQSKLFDKIICISNEYNITSFEEYISIVN